MIVGRARERKLLDRLLRALPTGGGALVMWGEPGVGKTKLLHYVGSAAGNIAGARVLRLRGVESEIELPFAGLADLLLPLAEHITALPAAQRQAIEACLALSVAPVTSPYAACAAALNVLAAASESGPLVILVDDLHWIDPATRQVLLFVARRLESERIVVIITTRAQEGTGTAQLVLPSVEVTDLSPAHCADLLHTRGIEVSPPVLEQLMLRAGGNPLALLEMAVALRAAQARGAEPLGFSLPLGDQLERAWANRLDHIPEDCRQALVLLAACRSSSTSLLAAALAVGGRALSDLDPALRAGLVRADEARVEFRHPLVRTYLLRHAGPASLRAVNRLLAAASTGDQRTWYLAGASADVDETLALALAEIADGCRRRGAYAEAARARRRAADLTPAAAERALRLRDAAIDALLAGLVREADACSESALRLTADPGLRAELTAVRGRVRSISGDPAGAADDLEQAAEALAANDPATASVLLAEAVIAAALDNRNVCAARLALRCQDLVTRSGLDPLADLVTACIAFGFAAGGQHAAAREYLLGHPPPSGAGDRLPLAIRGRTLALVHADQEAARALSTVIVDARRSHAPARFAHCLTARAGVEFRRGRWAVAYADATEGLRWAEEIQQIPTVGDALACLALLDAARGERERAEQRVARLRRLAGRMPLGWLEVRAAGILGFAALCAGEYESAAAHLMHAWSHDVDPDTAADGDRVHEAPYAADLVEALLRSGQAEQAKYVLDWLDAWARRSGLADVAALVARCCGLAADRAEVAEAEFATALAAHARHGVSFERARTLLMLGETRLRFRQPRAARAPLRAALGIFSSLGAAPWAARATAALATVGGRQPRPGWSSVLEDITPQELQVARMVATGMNNLEVSAALYVSRKTVEAHLTRIYRKLGVRSRTELTRLLLTEGVDT
ncbi:ATP-dependent transcriptional regulator [Frankia sp. EI5c]|uniref:helix-turn-helix transcriptional regulator n=1 Tax=Frankia sp. EI5c TaxID=683316 RepID=UPI0007C32137|nr:helix-turn-helix transcriptional regulator [Frankia sp. EI5c]OAA20994.1 ATP-dependent transcriptional regulator [Frankia sp. EI5c]